MTIDPKIAGLMIAIEVAFGVWAGHSVGLAILTADTLSTSISASAGLLIAVAAAKKADRYRNCSTPK